MSLPLSYSASGGATGIEIPPRRRQLPNQPPNLLTTSLGNARGAGLGVGAVVQTPISSTTLSGPFSAYPQYPYPQSPAGAARGASPMASQSASAFSGHYNPQQWGVVNNVSPNSMSMAGEHRQTSQSSRAAHLAPRLVGPDGKGIPDLDRTELIKMHVEPVASPPPPYSPRRDQPTQNSTPRNSNITSPADTISPDTESLNYATPASAATTFSPDLVSRFPGGRSPLIRQHPSPNESPNAASAISFPPPPGAAQRKRKSSRKEQLPDRLLSSLTLRGKPSKTSLAGYAIETLQDHTAQVLAQASATHNDAMVQPPGARRAASTGGIGLAVGSSRSTSQSPSPATWEPNTPLPPPPPGPPPASMRSQSLNRPMESPSSGLAPTHPLRFRGLPGTGTRLDTVPPTPADWKEEDGTNARMPSRDRSHGPSPLHIDTGSITRKRRSGADYPMTASAYSRRDSSAGGLFRSPAVRNRSAMGIRERRSESRNGKARAVEDSVVESPRSEALGADECEDVRPSNLILLTTETNASKQRAIAKSTTPKSGNSMQSLDGAMKSPEIQNSSGKEVSSSYTTPQPGSSRSHPYSADLTPTPPTSPGRQTLDRPTSVIASPSLPPKRLSGVSKTLSLTVPPESEQRPISHLLHSPNPGNSMQAPLKPSTKGTPEPPEDLLGPESPKLFAGRAIERHRIFAEREAAAANDSQRLELFVRYMNAESRIRREQYASVFEEDCIDVDELTQGLFRYSSLDRILQDRQQSLPKQDTSKRTSIASSEGDSSAISRKHESPSSATTNSSTQQRPESAYWKDYVPVLSPIAASMSIVTGQDEKDSRGRAPSRWFEDQSHSGDDPLSDAFKVLERSNKEAKYMGFMGMPREARTPPALYGSAAFASTGGGQLQPPGASRQPSYGPNQYPPEKTSLHEEESHLPPPPFIQPTPSSAPFTPGLNISRLVTLPPPFPRHHPAVNNSHPELADVRSVVRSLHEKEEAETITDSYRMQILGKRQRAYSWCKQQRSLHRQDVGFRIEHGGISPEDFTTAEVELEEKVAISEKEIAQSDFDLYQHLVLTPLHALFSNRIQLADESLNKLSSRLFSDAQSQNPNLPQEEGDEQPELLEKLTLLKWLYEGKETLHRQIYDLLSERNDRYKAIVLLPYEQSQNQEKHAEAESFFATDAQERRLQFEQAVCQRAQAFLSVIENNVSRGVEVQLSVFWDIAPSLLEVLHRVPSRLDDFEVQIPAHEYAENPSYYDHPLQYLYSLLGHAEKSTYQFIESQVNLLCLLHEIRSHALAARCKVEAQGRDASWESEGEQRREETRLTDDLKEKVGVVEGQWEEALGREVMEVRERVRGTLLEEGGWDDEGNEV